MRFISIRKPVPGAAGQDHAGTSAVANSVKTCYPRKDCCSEPTSEAAMSDDPDLPKADHALLVIRQARLSRNEAAAMMIADLIYETPTPHGAAPKLKKLIKPRGWPFPSWRDPSVKK